MTARLPLASTKRQTASTFGPMLPRANCPSAACSRSSATVDPAERPGVRRAEAEHHVRDVGRDHEDVGLDVAPPAARR